MIEFLAYLLIDNVSLTALCVAINIALPSVSDVTLKRCQTLVNVDATTPIVCSYIGLNNER